MRQSDWVQADGWSPLGVTPVQISRLHRDQRHQILPAYAQDGIMLARVFQGSTDTAVLVDFIEQLTSVPVSRDAPCPETDL